MAVATAACVADPGRRTIHIERLPGTPSATTACIEPQRPTLARDEGTDLLVLAAAAAYLACRGHQTGWITPAACRAVLARTPDLAVLVAA